MQNSLPVVRVIQGRKVTSMYEDDELESMKKDDSYFYSISFEWPVRDGEGEWTTLSTTMDVEVEWNDYERGYEISFDCPDEDKIVNSGGNLAECYNDCVLDEVIAYLNCEDIPVDAICGGGVAW